MSLTPGGSWRGATPDPQEVGAYRIEGVIARGGMGSVYRAVDRRDGRRVALKMILAGRGATAEQRRRFEREVEAMRALDCDGVVRVLDAGVVGDVPWYAMEFVEGPSLTRATGALDLRQRLEVMAAVCRAVAAAHEQGYVHRDLKPDNVLIERRGQAFVPRVTDFGLAKQVGGESRLTADGAVLGTPHYMAPEQATGDVGRTSPATDVFSLGVMLYQLATGRLPFEGKTALELMAQIVEAAPASFESSAAGEVVDADGPRALLLALEPVALRALEKDPADRYPTALQLADDLDRVLRGEPPAARRQSAADRLVRRALARPRRAALLLLAPIIVLAGFAGVALGVRALRARREVQARLAERRASLTQALKDLERALGPGSDAGVLVALLDQADALTDLVRRDAPGAPAPFDPALRRRAVLRLLEAAVLDEGRDAAEAALARARSLGDGLLADLAAPDRAEALLALGRLTVRAGAPADDVVAALRPLDAARADLLEGVAALARGRRGEAAALEAAVAALGRAATTSSAAAHALRADALARLGRDDDARAALRDAGGGASALRRWAEAVLEREAAAAAPDDQALDGAFEALARALRDAPADPKVARRLLALGRATGRVWDAWEALDGAARRPTATPVVRALAARAAALLGRDAAAALADLGEEPEALLLAADLASARGEADPYAPLDRLPPAAAAARDAGRAARARWLAGRDPAAARAELEALTPRLAAPADVPPDPLAARRLRDAGWARLALGDPTGAAACAAEAVRGLPFDLDALALLARVEPAAAERLTAALRREAAELDGPLGRGLLLVRAGAAFERPALCAEGAALLEARLAGDPAVFPAALFAARARGQPDPADPLPWLGALALVDDPPRPSAEERADALRMASAPGTGDAFADCERYRGACALDPLGVRPRWEYALLRNQIEAGSTDALLEWGRLARLKPNSTMRFVSRVEEVWRAVSASSPRVDVERAVALGPDVPLHHALDVIDRYLGLVDPTSTRPAFARSTPRATRRTLDALVLRDARMIGFLALRAHLSELDGHPGAADRDLDLLERAFADEKDALERDGDTYWVVLQRAAVCAARRPRAALDAVARLPRPLPHDGHDGNDLAAWLRGPVFEPIRGELEFREFLASWR